MAKAVAASDYAPLLVQGDDDPAAHHTPANRIFDDNKRVMLTICLCLIMVINGGTVGAFGPSLEMFERKTGLSQAVLGGAVMQNRLAKLVGAVTWGCYANRLQQKHGKSSLLQPHFVVSGMLLVSACCVAVRRADGRGM